MTEKEIFEKVQYIVSEQLGVEKSKITPEAHFTNDLGADSLDLVELVMTIEGEFRIDISDEQAENIESCQQAVDCIRQLSPNT
uniref:Acyl carrier protein n=1 Tax=Gronococcus sybilensis TaxID=3028029 RepID=A0A9Y1I2N7_9RHOD|nr:acyl carrier protein [Gronococcus sybilensis]